MYLNSIIFFFSHIVIKLFFFFFVFYNDDNCKNNLSVIKKYVYSFFPRNDHDFVTYCEDVIAWNVQILFEYIRRFYGNLHSACIDYAEKSYSAPWILILLLHFTFFVEEIFDFFYLFFIYDFQNQWKSFIVEEIGRKWKKFYGDASKTQETVCIKKFLTRVKSRGDFEKVGQQMAHKARGKFCKSTTHWYEATSILEFAIARESGRRGVAMNRLVRLWLLRFIIAQWKGKM